MLRPYLNRGRITSEFEFICNESQIVDILSLEMTLNGRFVAKSQFPIPSDAPSPKSALVLKVRTMAGPSESAFLSLLHAPLKTTSIPVSISVYLHPLPMRRILMPLPLIHHSLGRQLSVTSDAIPDDIPLETGPILKEEIIHISHTEPLRESAH
jgi:hypothetical protein